ncbi:hypothetical protein ACSW8Q_17110 (plasmid) [Clostridium perfringens]|uniref:TcpK family conjugal transfer DNA-binding protein n=1 Tax=Clostridium perfringens TaxID=1502 RepID=UPI0024BC15EA|nr:hypothetical protein [Clostridium perfringens]ELC8464229.1 hypothetical protein [Clostridium perfringens]
MEEIIKYFKDFYNIFEYLNKKEIGFLSKDIQEYYVKKKDLEKLLAVNNYDTVDGKLSVWRAIGLINIRENRYTKQVRIKGKIINVVALKVSAYNALKKLEVEKNLCEK